MTKSLIVQSINENKKPLGITLVGIIISFLLGFLTIKTTYYWAFLSIPFSIIAITLFATTIKQTVQSYGSLKKKEENLPDGEYRHTYLESAQAKQIFSLKDGKREGLSKGYYESGQLKYEIHYKRGLQTGQATLYDKSGKIVRKSEYLDDNYLEKCTEYYSCGKVRMTQENSTFRFYDKNEVLRLIIYVNCEIITMDEYRNHKNNCWYKWHWNNDKRALYTPHGSWEEYNDEGTLTSVIEFGDNESKKQLSVSAIKFNVDAEGSFASGELITPEELYIERFASNFAYERLIDKKARYKTMHVQGRGWNYAEFSIPEVLTFEDVMKVNSVTIE